MNEILIVLLITILAVVSPGADFALITRNSYLYGRLQGRYTAYGIACGVWIHVFYSLIALNFVRHSIPGVLQFIQYLGAFYLIYIGYKTFTHTTASIQETKVYNSRSKSFKQGFLTNALNPKTMLFIMSLFSQVMNNGNNTWVLLGYGIFISAAHLIWFLLIVQFCSTPNIRNKILEKQIFLNKGIGLLLVLLGVSLIFSQL